MVFYHAYLENANSSEIYSNDSMFALRHLKMVREKPEVKRIVPNL